ncbi:hypothetical protein MYAM1_002998 [Malassezia yamatoensis]|uniref:Peptide hydrolase n=1 Tax=Malassezia yamatoensis TaxID=253288 RepID=A0AAJ5YTT2_9BASI|nr:hypothetical protein MYAM1_002998 [Malassezia yamatoensis]
MPPRRRQAARPPRSHDTDVNVEPDNVALASEPTSSQRLDPDARKSIPIKYKPERKNIIAELGSLALYLVLLASITMSLHYKLPLPMETTKLNAPRPERGLSDAWYTSLYAGELDASSLPMYQPVKNASFSVQEEPVYRYFSEGNALLTIQHLSEDIGYRVVGTQQHIDAEEWVEQILNRFVGSHDTGGNDYKTHVELFKQYGDGAHRFEILGHPVWKQYYSMSNLIVRISDGTPESLQNTLLLNAHIDSTLPSPGAADDGAGVAIMMELLRVLTLPGAPRVKHGIILLFNNGEESLQDASQLYMTQHKETNQNIRAVINMEACGTSGPSLLFQATDQALITAYASVPHPFGTVLASDVFSSGLIMSDTDFRQFAEYGNGLPGLDMAIVGSSYLYHTRLDTPAHIERGVLQHFGENVFSLVESLALAPNSSLPGIKPWPYAVKQIMPVYFSLFGRYMVQIAPKAFKGIVIAVGIASNFFLSAINSSEIWISSAHYALLCSLGVIVNLLAALVGAGIAAWVMRALQIPMSWFANEFYAMILYIPPSLAGIVAVQIGLHHLVEKSRRPYLEHATFTGSYILFTFGLLVMNMFGLGSAYLMLLAFLSSFVPITINDVAILGLDRISRGQIAPDRRVHFATYFLGLLCAATVGVEGLCTFLDLLVPLMGRMGKDVPVDYVIGALIAALTTLNTVCLVPLTHRYGLKFMQKTFYALVTISVLALGFFSVPSIATFDKLHPRRLLVHHVENITSGEWHVAYSTLDAASPNAAMSRDIENLLLNGAPATSLSWDNETLSADMDVLFPLTHFIDTERIGLPATPERAKAAHDPSRWANFRLTCQGSIDEVNATRTVTLHLHHPALAWSTVAFDAEVLDWDFPNAPPEGHQRHHLKDVSRLGANDWTMRMVLRMTPQQLEAWHADKSTPYDTLRRTPPGHEPTQTSAWRIPVHYSSLDAWGMYPHHKDVSMDRLSMQTLEQLDSMLLENYPEIDAMLMSIVAGVAEC